MKKNIVLPQLPNAIPDLEGLGLNNVISTNIYGDIYRQVARQAATLDELPVAEGQLGLRRDITRTVMKSLQANLCEMWMNDVGEIDVQGRDYAPAQLGSIYQRQIGGTLEQLTDLYHDQLRDNASLLPPVKKGARGALLSLDESFRAIEAGVQDARTATAAIMQDVAFGVVESASPAAEQARRAGLQAAHQSITQALTSYAPDPRKISTSTMGLAEQALWQVFNANLTRAVGLSDRAPAQALRMTGPIMTELLLPQYLIGEIEDAPEDLDAVAMFNQLGRQRRHAQPVAVDAPPVSVEARQLDELRQVVAQVEYHLDSGHLKRQVVRTYDHYRTQLQAPRARELSEGQYELAQLRVQDCLGQIREEMDYHRRQFDGWSGAYAMGKQVKALPVAPVLRLQ